MSDVMKAKDDLRMLCCGNTIEYKFDVDYTIVYATWRCPTCKKLKLHMIGKIDTHLAIGRY